jgi:hypothetical protein
MLYSLCLHNLRGEQWLTICLIRQWFQLLALVYGPPQGVTVRKLQNYDIGTHLQPQLQPQLQLYLMPPFVTLPVL